MDNKEIEKTRKAGMILKEVREYSKSFIKKGMKLIEIANKIDSKIIELGGKPAFPVNLSINEVAAHATPAWNSEEVASGLLKVDIGVHVDGFVADSAYSIDLDDNEDNKRLIEAAESALNDALKAARKGARLRDIGKAIESSMEKSGFSPIVNLSGHEVKQYDLHAGLTIPNIDNGDETILEDGVYAIEPFATFYSGKKGSVKNGKPSGIYQLKKNGNVRDIFAREVLGFIITEYRELPFCSRWIHKKFGDKGLLALRQINQSGLLHEYTQLVETNGKKVAQAEHTLLIKNGDKIVTTN